MNDHQYFQCKLTRGNSTQTAWIPARSAREGLLIELMPSRELWTVVEVYANGLPEDVLKNQQQMNRKSLPSVEGMGR